MRLITTYNNVISCCTLLQLVFLVLSLDLIPEPLLHKHTHMPSRMERHVKLRRHVQRSPTTTQEISMSRLI